jgi:hypothetical protein
MKFGCSEGGNEGGQMPGNGEVGWGWGAGPLTGSSAVPGLAAYRDGVTVICELAAQFGRREWSAQTPCAEWGAADLAG